MRLIDEAVVERIMELIGKPPEGIAEEEGIEIYDMPGIPKRFDDCIIYKVIFIPRGISEDERTWRISHCLGHYFMHALPDNEGWGNLFCRDRKGAYNAREYKIEMQADLFAAYLYSHMM